jgi:hypothetical protein
VCVRYSRSRSLSPHISTGGVASETSNGRNGPCPVHLPLQAESNFRAVREQETRRPTGLCEPTPALTGNKQHFACKNGCTIRWERARLLARVLLRGVDGEPLIGHCPSLSRSFFIFSPGAERATPFGFAARTLSGLFCGTLIVCKSFAKQRFIILQSFYTFCLTLRGHILCLFFFFFF